MIPTAARQVDSHTPGTPEWLQQRRARLGGSEIAAVLGLSPYESRFSLWHRKLDLVPPVADSPVMEWGRRLEGVVLDKFFEDHADLTHLGRGSWLHPEHDFMLASPDAIALGDTGLIVVDAKTGSDLGPEWGDSPPIWYVCQLRWYMEVLGAQEAWVAALLDGRTYREYRIQPDPGDTALMVTEGRDFIASLAEGRRPNIDEHSQTYQVLRDLHPDIDPDVDATVTAEIAGEYLDSILCAKQAESRLTGAKSRLLDAMGSARVALVEGPEPSADRRFAYRRAAGPDASPYPTYYPKALARLAAALNPRQEGTAA